MIFENYDRIVFAGDSVTDMGSTNPVGEGLFDNVGRSYVRVIENMLSAYYPEVFIRVTNSGISGNTSRDLRARFDRDVVDLKPDWVSICIGINDVWRQFDTPAITSDQVMPDEYAKNLEEHNCTLIDFQKMYSDYCTFRHSSYIAWDRIHPNQIGATLMAKTFLEKCGFDYNHKPVM